ncbi:MAG: 3-deoxy-7-phosphoheptulonate synthase [Puniceicoccales bacterium]|jgi:3-deoxy-7-phosphoheptulonate synthase|nr:3-deoxy-7-phosphoheptulonate synthase [Puniceicoccales bacterium]
MFYTTDDLRIKSRRPLVSPAILLEELALSEGATEVVASARRQISDVIQRRDDRLLVVTGPCSINDPKAAEEYATRLLPLVQKYAQDLVIVMRVYFEKPRTVVGWKGLINDPFIDESFQINRGLHMARKLLLDVVNMGIPTATEFLDVITPQFIADLVCYGAIGARTTESQVHRELASGLSMPVGFKNGTTGNMQMAVDAICSAKHSHWFASVTKDGVTAIFQTAGNNDTHIVLRGGSRTGPNYEAKHVAEAVALLEKAKQPGVAVIDCSHGNSAKDHKRQPIVAADVAKQIAGGSRAIVGVMLESHLVEGNQAYTTPDKAVYGQSITDACISFDQTVPIIEELAAAVRKRRQTPST